MIFSGKSFTCSSLWKFESIFWYFLFFSLILFSIEHCSMKSFRRLCIQSSFIYNIKQIPYDSRIRIIWLDIKIFIYVNQHFLSDTWLYWRNFHRNFFKKEIFILQALKCTYLIIQRSIGTENKESVQNVSKKLVYAIIRSKFVWICPWITMAHQNGKRTTFIVKVLRHGSSLLQ